MEIAGAEVGDRDPRQRPPRCGRAAIHDSAWRQSLIDRTGPAVDRRTTACNARGGTRRARGGAAGADRQRLREDKLELPPEHRT